MAGRAWPAATSSKDTKAHMKLGHRQIYEIRSLSTCSSHPSGLSRIRGMRGFGRERDKCGGSVAGEYEMAAPQRSNHCSCRCIDPLPCVWVFQLWCQDSLAACERRGTMVDVCVSLTINVVPVVVVVVFQPFRKGLGHTTEECESCPDFRFLPPLGQVGSRL